MVSAPLVALCERVAEPDFKLPDFPPFMHGYVETPVGRRCHRLQ